MRKWILGLACAVMAAASANTAQAGGGPFSVLRPQHQSFGDKPVLPVFQAAPWYLYWPYDGHFMTPAPLPSGFQSPPGYGGYGGYGGYNQQPYFPASPMNQYPGTPMNIIPR